MPEANRLNRCQLWTLVFATLFIESANPPAKAASDANPPPAGGNGYPWAPVIDANQTYPTPSSPKISLGEPQAMPFASGNIQYAPDGHVSFEKTQRGYRVFFPSSTGESYLATGSSLETLQTYTSNSNPAPVLAPGSISNPNSYNYDYDGIDSVSPLLDGRLMCFTEAENHPNRPSMQGQIHSIGYAFSDDGGHSWKGEHQTIDQPKLNAGLPSALVVNLKTGKNGPRDREEITPTIYCYYIGWFAHNNPTQPKAQRSTCLATQPLSANGATSQWTFHGPVFTGGAAHITYNVYLRKFVAIFANYSNDYCLAVSNNGIDWSTPIDLGFNNKYPYPSLICPDQPSSLLSSRTGFIYYENGGLNCYRRSITLSK